jgi:NAD(P)-dependent dehydrogenase (short-subunit alcohol dehydrogenase family)
VKRLDEISVLVVDAGSRLGEAASTRFSQEGARVMVADADPEAARDIAQRLGPAAVPVQLDPLDPESCEEATWLAHRTFGALDVLCNRAAPAPSARKRLHELSEAEWRSTLDAGLNAVALPTRYALRVMSERGAGNVIVIGSAAGLVGVPALSAFAAATGGLLNFTRNVAFEARRSDRAIRANMLCLGNTWDDAGAALDLAAVGDALVFLASAESRLLNGAVVSADGGLTAWR